MECGIYKIVNILNGKVYVGQSRRIRQRWVKHRVALRQNKHDNVHLQRAWNKYGEEAFVFFIVERCTSEQLTEREGFYIDLWKTRVQENGYNLGGLTDGKKTVSEETREKLRQVHLGKPKNPDAIAKTAAARRGSKASPQTIQKLRESHLGQKHMEEQNQQMRDWVADPANRKLCGKGVRENHARKLLERNQVVGAPILDLFGG